MTPLDRIVDRFPGVRDLLFHLDDSLPVVVGATFVLLIALVFYWTFAVAPRRALRVLASLERDGFGPVDPEEPQLREALERLTPVIFHTYELTTVTATSAWRVRRAVARYDGQTSRYCALINRSVSRSPRQSTVLEHQHTVAFLERRDLPFRQEIHLAGDRYTLDRGYGLRQVSGETLGRLSSSYVVHTPDGTLDSLPARLEAALVESAPLLSIVAADGRSPFLIHARLKLSSAGWGLISSEYVYDQRTMDALRAVVERVSRALAPAAGR